VSRSIGARVDVCCVCRYVLNYLPFGVAYKACNLLPSKMLIVSVREVYRVRQIHTGFVYASTKFPNSAIVVAVYALMLGVYEFLAVMHMRAQRVNPNFNHYIEFLKSSVVVVIYGISCYVWESRPTLM